MAVVAINLGQRGVSRGFNSSRCDVGRLLDWWPHARRGLLFKILMLLPVLSSHCNGRSFRWVRGNHRLADLSSDAPADGSLILHNGRSRRARRLPSISYNDRPARAVNHLST